MTTQLHAGAMGIADIRHKLIDIARDILLTESQILAAEEAHSILLNQERKALLAIFHQKHMGNVVQNLRNLQESSPLLMALTSQSVDDLVKIIMLLQALSPQLNSRYESLLSQLKLISTNRLQLKTHMKEIDDNKEKLAQLTSAQEDLLNQKYRLFFKASHNPNLEEFAKEHSKISMENAPPKHFDDLVHQLQTLFSADSMKSPGKLQLIIPVNGLLCPHNHSDSTSSQDLSICFDTRPNAHVISPIEASVVFAGFIPSFGQVVILKQDDFFCVMTGLGAIHCFLGDTLLPGEPIGRMPLEEGNVKSVKLRLELHKGGQHLDPRPYLSVHTSAHAHAKSH